MAVAPGTIAFVGYSFDNYTAGTTPEDVQGFAFVTLGPIAAGESIRFVDGSWSGSALTVDSQVVWTNTTGAAIGPGTVIQATLGSYNAAANGQNVPGWTAATTNLGSITNPTNSAGAVVNSARWNVDLTDSLYAVTTTSGTAPGSFISSITWGATNVTGITAGATLFDPGTAATTNDVGIINTATANTAYANIAAAKASYANAANWITDDAPADDTGTTASADWPPLTDSNSPLNGHTTLTITTPTITFGDAGGLVNAAEATGTPVTIGGLGAGATAVVTFKSSADGTITTASFTGNGTVNANLSALADGTITITQVVVSNAGTNSTLANPAPASTVVLDETAAAVTSITTSGTDITAGSGALNAGDLVTLTVNVGEAVIVSGTPTLTLSSGGTATYDAAASTATVLKFTHTVGAGQNAADLTVSAITGTIKDAAGNNLAFNSVTTGNPAGTLAIDTTAPTATTTIALVADTGAAGDGITSNPALTGTSSSGTAGETITIKDGATVLGTATTGAGGTWTFANAGATQAAHSYTAAVTDTAGNLGPAGSTTPASVTVDTTADTDVVVDLIDATAGPTSASIAFDLANLDAGSTATVTFTGAGGGTVSQAYTTNGAQTADISGLVGNVSATVLVTDRAGTTTAGSGDTLAADPVCFYPGTLIRTPSGDVAVEALRTGDLVLTHAGHVAPVRWMGRQTIATRFADALAALPIRIQAGALADNLPERDLLVSPGHAILLHGLLVQAGALVNGTSIRREAAVPEIFTYHHVELHDHALVLAEGVPAETYVANVERIAFDNAAEHVALYGVEVAIAELNLPRAKSHRQVPMALRQQIAVRATALSGAIAA